MSQALQIADKKQQQQASNDFCARVASVAKKTNYKKSKKSFHVFRKINTKRELNFK
jgi:hypothetical protein